MYLYNDKQYGNESHSSLHIDRCSLLNNIGIIATRATLPNRKDAALSVYRCATGGTKYHILGTAGSSVIVVIVEDAKH